MANVDVAAPGSSASALQAALAMVGLISSPQGRLTLNTGVPVMIADATAQTSVYYAPYVGAYVPIYDGTVWAMKTFAQLTLALNTTDNLSTKLHDIFVFNSSGTLTLGTGPAWTNSTTRANAISMLGGIWTNTASITLRAGGSSLGAQAANTCTYLGTLYCTANGQTGMAFRAAAAVGGSNPILGVWNAYNRVRTSSLEMDATSTQWTYNSATWRASNASNSNRISWVDGLAQSFVHAQMEQDIEIASTMAANIGVNLNSTSAAPATNLQIGNASIATLAGVTVSENFVPTLGFNYAQCMEASLAGTSIFKGTQGTGRQNHALRVELEM